MKQKLTSFALITTVTFQAIPSKVCALENEIVSSFEYSTTYGDYNVTQYNDGTLELNQENVNGRNTISISNTGEVVMFKDDGTKCIREVFNIEKMDGNDLILNKDKIKNKDLKNSLNEVENYFNSIEYNREDGIETYKSAISIPEYDESHGMSYKDMEDISRSQYSNVIEKVNHDYNLNMSITDNSELSLPVSLLLKLMDEDKYVSDEKIFVVEAKDDYTVGSEIVMGSAVIGEGIAAGIAAQGAVGGEMVLGAEGAAVAAMTTPPVLIISAVTLSLLIGYYLYDNAISNIDGIYKPDLTRELTLDEATKAGIDISKLNDIRDVLDKIKEYPKSCFRAYMIEGIVYIDLAHPMKARQANSIFYSNDVEYKRNIYSYTNDMAKYIIENKNFMNHGVPGRHLDSVPGPENHFYTPESQKYYYDGLEYLLDDSELEVKEVCSPGSYFWHYHDIYHTGNHAHSLFGFPKVKTK